MDLDSLRVAVLYELCSVLVKSNQYGFRLYEIIGKFLHNTHVKSNQYGFRLKNLLYEEL